MTVLSIIDMIAALSVGGRTFRKEVSQIANRMPDPLFLRMKIAYCLQLGDTLAKVLMMPDWIPCFLLFRFHGIDL